jgi:hypothetical protein
MAEEHINQIEPEPCKKQNRGDAEPQGRWRSRDGARRPPGRSLARNRAPQAYQNRRKVTSTGTHMGTARPEASRAGMKRQP